MDAASAGARSVARAIDALRRGWPVRIDGVGGALTLLAIEGASPDALAAFAPAGMSGLLLSESRAATLKITNQLAAAAGGDSPVLIAPAPWIDFNVAVAVADPVHDLTTPMKGPFRAMALSGQAAGRAALRLARLAGLLPSFFVGPADASVEAQCAADDTAAYEDATRLTIASRARLPVEAAHESEIVAFRSPEDAREHVALIIGKRDGSVPLVRVHSECLTGDIFGSLKCDCGPQLHEAMARMAHGQWGILLYLRQEGRGIGLINKLRAYALQDQGFDTVDANVRLGFAVDARDFAVAARMLALLGVDKVRLLTNNPDKVARLEATGIDVVERVPLIVETNPENEAYLATKRDRTGHQL